MRLADTIWDVFEASGTSDYQQRSALGIARAWVDKRKPHERIIYKEHANETKRDELAESLIAMLDEAKLNRDEYIEILGDVRQRVNAPFFDPSTNGAKSGKALLKPGERKKAAEKGEKS